MPGKLEQKVAIITGAGAGLGRATAKKFASEGATVVVAAKRAENGMAVVDEIITDGGEGLFVQTDVSVDSDLRSAIDAAVGLHGRIDVLVNNVAIGRDATGPFWEISEEAWDATYATNVRSMFIASKYAYPHMPDGSSIINVGSAASLVAYGNEVCYVSTKGAVLQMTRAMACDCAGRNIRVNCLCPGTCDTPGMRWWIDNAPDPAEMERVLAHNSLFNRLGRPEEVANAALFLASSDSSFVTGTALSVDGGFAGCRPGMLERPTAIEGA